MKLHHRAAIAVGLAVPASTCAPTAPAVRVDHSVTPPTEPSSTLAGAVVPTSAPAASAPTTTTLLVTTTSPLVVMTPTTIRMALPEDDGTAGQHALATWYDEGDYTANGDRFDPSALTFAHLTMPFGTQVLFKGPLGSVVATCTDRGPAAWTGRTFDLSRGTFSRIAQLSAGVVDVTWTVVG